MGPVRQQSAAFLDFSWLEKSDWLNWEVGCTCKEECLVGRTLCLAVFQVDLWRTWHCLVAWLLCWLTLVGAV